MGSQLRKTLVVAAIAVAVILGVATMFVSSQTEWNSETSVQIAARRLDDGRVEFGLRQRQADGWSDLSLPSQRYLLPDVPVDEWQLSDEIAVTGTSVNVHIRDGVYVGDWQDEFLVHLDGEVYQTNCSRLYLELLGQTVLIQTVSEDCSQRIGLATVCGSPESECDRQRAMMYPWEQAIQRAKGYEAIRLSHAESQEIVDAVYADYLGSRQEPPAVKRAGSTVVPHFDPGDNAIYLADWSYQLWILLHETAHAIIDAGTNAGNGHHKDFAALMLDVWASYTPSIDVKAAKLAAQEFGVEIADATPIHARTRHGVGVLWSLLCTEPVRSEAYCDALIGSMRLAEQPLSFEGEIQPALGRGRIDASKWWGAEMRDESLFSYVVSEAAIDEQPELIARFRVICHENVLRVGVWWQVDRATSSGVLIRFGASDFRRESWSPSKGSWHINGVETDFRVTYTDGIEAERVARELVWAAAGGDGVSLQARSGADTYTAVFDLDGLFETPVQPNLARCGREAG